MLKLTKKFKTKNKVLIKTIKVLADGTCLVFYEDKLIKKYMDLNLCLKEHSFNEFLKGEEND